MLLHKVPGFVVKNCWELDKFPDEFQYEYGGIPPEIHLPQSIIDILYLQIQRICCKISKVSIN